jgi:3-oxoacyl-[acyl-carrier protein] reductase
MTATAWEGRVALVTGGTLGIGRGVVDRLLSEGGSVTVVARDEARLRELAAGEPRVAWCAGDVTAPETAERAVATCLGAFGVIDALINDAGGSAMRGWDAADDEWREMIELNLLSAVRMCRAAIPHLRGRPGPRIVNVGTELVYLPHEEFVPYTAAKAALLTYTKSLSRALAGDGILVNAVCPGTIETPLSRLSMIRLAEERGETVEDATAYFCREVRDIPLRRLGRPAEAADAIVYLASLGCSFVTGAVLRCDGGSSRSPF